MWVCFAKLSVFHLNIIDNFAFFIINQQQDVSVKLQQLDSSFVISVQIKCTNKCIEMYHCNLLE